MGKKLNIIIHFHQLVSHSSDNSGKQSRRKIKQGKPRGIDPHACTCTCNAYTRDLDSVRFQIHTSPIHVHVLHACTECVDPESNLQHALLIIEN